MEYALDKNGNQETFTYDGVISGKKVNSWVCPLIYETFTDEKGNEKKRKVPYTHEPETWWKENYAKENGAFWYKVS